MKSRKLLLVALLLITGKSFSQIWTKIQAKDGIHYITCNAEFIEIPIWGKYMFKGKEPVVELNEYGTGFYQLHEQPKRPVTWGLECDEKGALLYKKGFDNTKYVLWYQYTDPAADDEDDLQWKSVECTIHFNTSLMFLQGERSKEYKPKASK
ncbi:hypothetical protein [Flavobacterium sp.]